MVAAACCRYYSNCNIKACLLLKSPDRDGEPAVPTATFVRVRVRSAYDAQGAMTNVRMAVVCSERISDELDESIFPPRIMQFTATVSQPPNPADYISLHRFLEKEKKSHWLENISRFKAAEMEAGLEGTNHIDHKYIQAIIMSAIPI